MWGAACRTPTTNDIVMKTKKDIFIVDGMRTAIGGLGKSLKTVPAVSLASCVIKKLLERNKIESAAVDEGILGNAVSAGLGQNPARQALIRAGLNSDIPAFTINKVCGSGLKAVILASQAILCGDAELLLAGGMENVSRSPHLIPRRTKPSDIDLDPRDNSLINDGLWCSINDTHMGTIADYTAKEYEISREEQDKYALESQRKAVRAQENGFFADEIVPVKIGDDRFFSVDEKPRKNSSIEKLAKVPPAFCPEGTVTAGNSPAPADGAAVLMISSAEGMKKNGLKPVARILNYATAAVEPKLVFTSAAKVAKKCLKAASISVSEVDIFEINEAFAVQAILTDKLVGIPEEKSNIFGGTIALGHPLGASGARGLVTLINALKRQNKKIGMTSICLGGGCAVALAVELM